MLRRVALAFVIASMSIGLPAYGQSGPSITVDPSVVPVGGTVTVKGDGFEPGLVRIYLDDVDSAPLAEGDHRGAFNFLLEIDGVSVATYKVIACNNQARAGACREEASAELTVIDSTTTTRPARTTTTTRPPTTTTRPATTQPASTTTRPPTTRPATTTTSPAVTIPPVTTSPPIATIATIAPTTVAGIAVATTQVPPPTVAPVIGASLPDGPDPTFDPNPDAIAIPTTTEGPSLATDFENDFPDLWVEAIEVTQGIQNKNSVMPLVAERTTWVRVHVQAEGVGVWGPVDGAMLLQRAGLDDFYLVPENGPIDAGSPRTDVDSALNFLLPDEFLDAGSLSITVGVWSFNPSTLDTEEPDPSNNLMQHTVEFHAADAPTIWLVALDDGGGPGPVVTDLSPLLGFAAVVHQDLLDYHPTAQVNYELYPAPVEPGPEAVEPGLWDLGLDADDDADDADDDETAGARRHEPNIRMSWLTEDLAEGANVLGWVDSSIPTGGYSGWAGYGVAWNKPNAGTPAHELGHSRGLAHVACKDDDDNGVPDELKGGAIDPTHPNGLPPNCSLAPISPNGYYGLTTEQSSLTVYSNDPTDPAAAFPFMSYKNPGWSDPYHWCRLLDVVGVPCNPAAIGVAPKIILPPVDCNPEPLGNGIGIDLCLIDQLPPPADPFDGGPEPLPFGGPSEYSFQPVCEAAETVHLYLTANGSAVDGESAADNVDCGTAGGTTPDGDITLERGYTATDTIWVPAEPESWIIVSGFVDLSTGEAAIQQVAMRDAVSASTEQRYRDSIVRATAGTAPMAYALSVVDQNDNVLTQVPVDLDGAGHGDGSESGPMVGFYQAVPISSCGGNCFIKIADIVGESKDSVPISKESPIVSSVTATNSGDATLVEWAGSDPDGDPLTYDVLWSRDGVEWIHAATGVEGPSISLPHSARYPGGDEVLVKVVANDGARTGEAVSEPFAAPGNEPLLLITGVPESGAIERFDMVLLQAHLLDPEDGVEQNDSLQWQSSLDGELGTGALLRTRDLGVGTHTITVGGADGDGNSVSTSFEIEITPRTTPTRYLETPDSRAVAMLSGQIGSDAGDAGSSGASSTTNSGDSASDNSSDSRNADDDGGSSAPLVIGVAALAGLAGGAGMLSRRRRSGGSGRAGSRNGP
jgi:hypothetical protein